MHNFMNQLYIEAKLSKNSWNKMCSEWWNTALVKKSRNSGNVSVPIVAVNPIYLYYSLGGPYRRKVNVPKFLYGRLRLIYVSVFRVEGLTKIRNIEVDMSVSVW